MAVELYFSINYLVIILIVALSSIDRPLQKFNVGNFIDCKCFCKT